MGALMHTLHADQRRLEERAEAIPGLTVTHLDAPARGERELRLMADNAEQRTLIEALTERNAVLARRVAELERKPADAASIATAIKGIKTLRQDDAKTIIAAVAARVRQEEDCDAGDCIDALDAAHDAEWFYFGAAREDVYAGELDDRGCTGIKR